LTLILTTVHTIYLIWKKGSRRVWSINRGCLLLHGTWSHLWYIQRSMNAHSLICISYNWTYEIEYFSLFLSFHIKIWTCICIVYRLVGKYWYILIYRYIDSPLLFTMLLMIYVASCICSQLLCFYDARVQLVRISEAIKEQFLHTFSMFIWPQLGCWERA
jgi:hypothetical protein